MSFTVQIDTRHVEHVLAATERFTRESGRKVTPLVRRLLTRVEDKAVNLAPVATGTLRRSAIGEIVPQGNDSVARVSFGGLASKYALVQHERTDFRHTLPEGVSRTQTKRGKRRKRPLQGYKGGQAKFLYGAANSAWNPAEAAHWARLLDRELGRIAEREINP